MTDPDERLATVLRDSVPQPPRALDNGTLRAGASRRTARSRIMAPVPAAAAVIAVVAGVFLAVHHPSAQHHGSNPPAGPSTGRSFEVRPLLMPAASVTHARPNPFAGVSFRIPSTEAGYSGLTAREQHQVWNALRGVDCANPPRLPNGPDRIVCDTTGSMAVLVGPPILTPTSVASAVAVPPSGPSTWTVAVTFTRPAARVWHAWMSQHHAGAASVGSAQSFANCGPTTLPCSDFVAFIVGDRVISIPITLAALDRVTSIAGNFDKAGAIRLAHEIAP